MFPSNYVGGYGPHDARLMVVGEAPGVDEDREQIPFVGRSGEKVNEFLLQAGEARFKVYTTNVFKYRPPGNLIHRAEETGHTWAECIDEFWKEVETIQPNCILALGGTALHVITGKSGISKWRGSILLAKDGKTKVVATYHPAYILHQMGDEDEEGDDSEKKGGEKIKDLAAEYYIKFDFCRAVEQSKFPEYVIPNRTLEIAKTPGEVYRYLDTYRNAPKVSVDIEPQKSIPSCIALACDKLHGMSIPLLDLWRMQGRTDGPGTQNLAEMYRLVGSYLESGVKIVGQNFKFDHQRLEGSWGLYKFNVHSDVMFKAHTLYPELPKTLGFLTSLFTDQPYYKDDGKEFRLDRHRCEQLLRYNAMDACVTLEIDEVLDEELDAVNVPGFPNWKQEFFYDFVMPLHSSYMSLERVGLPVNHKRQADLIRLYDWKIRKVLARLQRFAGWQINPWSPKQVHAFLFRELKFPFRKKTDEDTLVALLGNHTKDNDPRRQALDDILMLRRLRKSKNTYFAARCDYDGRMRTSYNIVGARTGRTSTRLLKKPNRPEKMGLAFHTMTKHGDVGVELRAMFEAPPGYSFVEIDGKQAEARVVALLGSDTETLRMFKEGIDIHKLTAAMIFSKKIEKVTKEERFMGKTVRHAGNYGLKKHRLMELINTDAKKFHIDVKISEYRAGKILEAFHDFSPCIRGVFHPAVVNALLDNDKVLVTPHGRRRQFLGWWGDDLKKEAYAYIPQATVGDITKRALVAIHRRWPETRDWICIEAHDALLALLPDEFVDEYIRVAVEEFERPVDFSRCTIERGTLVIPAEIKRGRNYKDLKDYVPQQKAA